MKELLTPLLLLASFVAFAQKRPKDPYIGQSKSQIVVWFGQPEKTDANAKGEVLSFRRLRKEEWNKGEMPYPSAPEKRHVGSVKRIETYKFFFDKKDVVYSWKVDTL